MDSNTDVFSLAVKLIVHLKHKEVEELLRPLVENNDVTALTLLAEAAWLRAMMSEDKSDLKVAFERLEQAEIFALKGCDSQRGTLLGNLYKLASWQTTKKNRFESLEDRSREFSNCTNLAYVYLMQSLVAFRGSAKNYLTGAFKLKAAWRLYKHLWENEVTGTSLVNSSSNSSTPYNSGRSETSSEVRTSKAGHTPASTPRTKRRIQAESVLDSIAASSIDDGGAFTDSSQMKANQGKDGVEIPSHLLKSSVADVYFGVGGFHFFISMVPTGFKWIVESLGFRGDREAGRRELQECVEKGGHRAASALLLLLWMDTFFYKERKVAEQTLSEAASLFALEGKKQSSLFQYMGGYLARVQGNLNVAISRFTYAKDAANESQVLQLMCDYEMGWCHYLGCDFQKAIESYEPFMKEFKSPSYRAYCAYQLGCALDIVGRPQDARVHMASVHKFVRKNFTFDQYAQRKAAQWLKLGSLSPFERAIIIVINHLEAKNHMSGLMALGKVRETLAQKTLRNLEVAFVSHDSTNGTGVMQSNENSSHLVLEEVVISDDCSAVYCYCLGRGLRGVGRLTEALECFQRVVEKESCIKEETYVLPYTYCEIGELMMRDGRTQEARTNLRIAKARYQNFDFDKPLGRRLKLALDLLKDRKKGIKI